MATRNQIQKHGHGDALTVSLRISHHSVVIGRFGRCQSSVSKEGRGSFCFSIPGVEVCQFYSNAGSMDDLEDTSERETPVTLEEEEEDTSSATKETSANLCTFPHHEREIVVAFCNPCEKTVCGVCLRVGHKDHKMAELADQAAQVRQQLQVGCLFFPAYISLFCPQRDEVKVRAALTAAVSQNAGDEIALNANYDEVVAYFQKTLQSLEAERCASRQNFRLRSQHLQQLVDQFYTIASDVEKLAQLDDVQLLAQSSAAAKLHQAASDVAITTGRLRRISTRVAAKLRIWLKWRS